MRENPDESLHFHRQNCLRIGIHQDRYLGMCNFRSMDLFTLTDRMKFTTSVIFEDMKSNTLVYKTTIEDVFFKMLFVPTSEL